MPRRSWSRTPCIAGNVPSGAVVMGFVGAGGLGQLMDQAMKLLNGGEAATILLVFLLLVLLADALSARLRKMLD